MTRPAPTEDQFVFNVVWTGTVFDHLQYFVASQIAQSGARFRFIANACPPDQLDAMERFSADHPGRVVEVVEVSSDRMVRHGQALDDMLRTRDDGDWFALIDPDIVARGPFLAGFCSLLERVDAVTSGKEVWSAHNVRPEGHPGVNGEYFFDHDGYVLGSPHFAIYRRDPLVETIERWGVGFTTAGNDLPDAARQRLVDVGRGYWVYDTAKVVNILFQEDGHPLRHVEEPALLHIGGVSHYLAPPSSAPAARDQAPVWGEEADWGAQAGMTGRFAVAEYTASVVRDLCTGAPAPEIPATVDESLRPRLVMVRDALVDLIATYGPSAPAAPPAARTEAAR